MSSSNQPKPKANKGRKKVKIEKIQNLVNLQVTFSKRRSGVMKKASELNTLCGAEVAVIVRCPKANKSYIFCHPSIKEVFDKYVFANPDAPPVDVVNPIVEAHRSAKIRELNLQLTHCQGMLAKEMKRAEELKNVKKQGRIEKWYPPPLEEFSLDELLIYKKSIENFGKYFNECAEKATHGDGQSYALPMGHEECINGIPYDATNIDDENIHAACASSFTVDPGSSYPNSVLAKYAPTNNKGVAGSSFCGNPNYSTSPFGFNFDDLSAGFVNPGQYGGISNATYEMPNDQIGNPESFNYLLSGLSDPNTHSVMSHSRDKPNSFMVGGSAPYNAFNNDIIGSSASPFGFNVGTGGSSSQSRINDRTGGSASGFNGGTMDLGQHSGFNGNGFNIGTAVDLGQGFNGGTMDLSQRSGFNSHTMDLGQHSGFNSDRMDLGQHGGFNGGTVDLATLRGFMDFGQHTGFNGDTMNFGHTGFNSDIVDLSQHSGFNSGNVDLGPLWGFNGDAMHLIPHSGINSGTMDFSQHSGFNGGTMDLGQHSGFNGGTMDVGQHSGFNGGTMDVGQHSGFTGDIMDVVRHSGFNDDTMNLGQYNGFNDSDGGFGY